MGGGAAGMMAAIAAAGQGAEVDLYEKNEKLGKKIYITGKGRCNLTNACETSQFPEHVCSNRKFLYSALYGFTAEDVMQFFEEAGTPVKVERGQRVFPVSDHASDVTGALAREMKRLGVRIHLNCGVKELLLSDAQEGSVCEGVRLMDGEWVKADAVIVCTGGLSYPTTGSTGDGYRFAKAAGHTVTELSPSLVPFNTADEDTRLLQGLSLRNIQVTIKDGKKTLFDEFGEMMFTHFGVTGPLILSASAKVGKKLKEKGELNMMIDLKPAISRQQLDERFLREFAAHQNGFLKNVLAKVYPSSLIPVILSRSELDPSRPIHEISREERQRLVEVTKCFTCRVVGMRGYNEAVVTRGGVDVRQVKPDTMESKLTGGLYFAGEVLDLDAVTGGYNLQIAWSTGHAAGLAAAEMV